MPIANAGQTWAKHFQTLAFHWFICFVSHNPDNPQESFSLGGREGWGEVMADPCVPRERFR